MSVASLWGALDDLCAKDPQGYKKFLSEVQTEAIKECKLPEGQYTLRCTGTPKEKSRVHCINVCKSDRLQAREGDRINVVVSKHRSVVGEDGKSFNVYDVVVHSTILKEAKKDTYFRIELQKLLLDCIEQSFSIRIDKESITRENGYIGPYGWDENGRPIDEDTPMRKAEELAKAFQAPSTNVPNMTPDSLLSGRKETGTGTSENEGPISLLGRKEHSIPAKIEELVIDPIVRPHYTTQTRDGCFKVEVELPSISHAAEIDVFVSDSSFDVEGIKLALSVKLPTNAIADQAKCQFLKSKHVLYLQCPLNGR
ncbi:PIH1 family [Phlyctochytrium arcticum]|nr:PIH1 family [Phlyctochytrium arcticum]